MKTKFILTVLASLTVSVLASAATNDAATLLERGLFEEEANHQLDAAIGDYKQAIEQFDRQRQLAATAIFRLGECYRKQGRTNEANAQYERIVREFPDQAQFAQLSRAYVPSVGGGATEASALPSEEEKFLRVVKESVRNSPDLVNQQLNFAAQNGYVSAAEFLLAHGADVNGELAGQSAMVAATVNGNEVMVQLLLSHSAAVDPPEGERSALSEAAEKGFMAVCQTLAAHGANVNSKDGRGRMPLHYAVENRRLAAAEFLITNKAQIDAVDGSTGQTPLDMACGMGDSAMVKLLLDHHADPNLESLSVPGGRDRMRPLYWAGDYAEIVKLLLEAHADPNLVLSSESANGFTPLMRAASSGRQPLATETLALLLDYGAKPNAMDSSGRTALIYAIGQGKNLSAVRLLMEHGADVNTLDQQGRAPWSYLHSPKTETGRQMEELLIKAGADADYNRRLGIWTADRLAGTPQKMIFSCPTNSINHFTLFEFLATIYKSEGDPFPDFAHVSIHRLEGKRSEVLPVNVADFFQSTNSSRDVALQAGDAIQIPEREHKVAESGGGLSTEESKALKTYLLRLVRIMAKGTTNTIALAPLIGPDTWTDLVDPSRPLWRHQHDWEREALKDKRADTVVRSLVLNEVVRDAKVLLNTWDLSRVQLRRRGAKATFNLTAKPPPPEVWLEDGDVIEIPELGESAPVTEAK